jgi:hypothetical protein
MKLLLKRDQAQSWTGRALFKLWGKIELDDLEHATVKKYRFDEKILIEVEQLTLMRNAAIVGVLAFIVAYAVLWLVGLNYTFLAIVLGAGGGYFYFHQMRETIESLVVMRCSGSGFAKDDFGLYAAALHLVRQIDGDNVIGAVDGQSPAGIVARLGRFC